VLTFELPYVLFTSLEVFYWQRKQHKLLLKSSPRRGWHHFRRGSCTLGWDTQVYG